MKKTNKTIEPSELTGFVQDNSAASWEDFRRASQGQSYKAVKIHALHDQGDLCAYCEVGLNKNVDQISIEHFHPKADKSNPNINWALDWQNMLAVCRGGRDKKPGEQGLYPTPQNLSCDAYKDHVGNPTDVFNPLTMPAEPIFVFDKSNGELNVKDGLPAELTELACETIRVLNLNCFRLCTARLVVLKDYNQLIKKAREQNNRDIHENLAMRWFDKRWSSYFTTRRSLLGNAAERYLEEIEFDG